jgi:hypothetical protein
MLAYYRTYGRVFASHRLNGLVVACHHTINRWSPENFALRTIRKMQSDWTDTSRNDNPEEYTLNSPRKRYKTVTAASRVARRRLSILESGAEHFHFNYPRPLDDDQSEILLK